MILKFLLSFLLLFGGSLAADKVDFGLNDIMAIAGMIGFSDSSAQKESAASYGEELHTLYTLADQYRKKYGPNSYKIPPKDDQGNAVKLDATFLIDHIEPLNEDAETMKVHGSVTLKWKDPRFVWTPDEHFQIKSISRSYDMWINSFRPWVPIFIFRDADPNVSARRGDHIPDGLNAVITATHTGEIAYVKKFSVKSSCDFNFHDFPYDRQRCELVMVAQHSAHEVWFNYDGNQEKHNARQLRNDGNSPMIGEFILDWMHVFNMVVKKDVKPEQLKGPWKDAPMFGGKHKMAAVVTLSFVRINEKYFYAFSIPLIGLVVLTQGAMFFDTGKGFLVNFVALLLLTVQMSQIWETFPTDSDGTPLLVVMHYLAVIHAVISFIGLVVLTYYYGKREGITKERKPCPAHYHMTERQARGALFAATAFLLFIIFLGTFICKGWSFFEDIAKKLFQ